jgi:hypothetical protein
VAGKVLLIHTICSRGVHFLGSDFSCGCGSYRRSWSGSSTPWKTQRRVGGKWVDDPEATLIDDVGVMMFSGKKESQT